MTDKVTKDIPERPDQILSRAHLSDQERMARGRAQIAAGDYLDVDDLDAYLDSLVVDYPEQSDGRF